MLGGLELSYAQPVHLVGGRGVFLEGADGRRYLDAYNNVPVLGHSHPAVVDAVCSQLATLNTNSRYLQEAPVELAERLLATLPDRFDRVLLVNSGSEANDLAWRIARPRHRRLGRHRDLLGLPRRHRGDVRVLTGELGRRGRPRHTSGWSSRRRPRRPRWPSAVESLDAAGHGVAAMLVDGVFTSDGIRGPAHEWTAAAAAAVHAAGGLYVADEVQAGHGRTGDDLWSFMAGGVPADLVTLGKPMGNGYPVAAVCGPAELVDPFIADTDYFSTFGGGTAACAAAIAVLRTIEEEHLVARVVRDGRPTAHGVARCHRRGPAGGRRTRLGARGRSRHRGSRRPVGPTRTAPADHRGHEGPGCADRSHRTGARHLEDPAAAGLRRRAR